MQYDQFQQDLERIYQSEVYGIALFTMAKRVAKNSERKAKWDRLLRLEEVTLACFEQYAEQHGVHFRYPLLWQLKGRSEGAALGLLPWRLAMKLLKDGTQDFQVKFKRLKDNADPSTQSFFNYVYAHEKSIEAFAMAELANKQDTLTGVEGVIVKGCELNG